MGPIDKNQSFSSKAVILQPERRGLYLPVLARDRPGNHYHDYRHAYHAIAHFLDEIYMTEHVPSALGYLSPGESETLQLARQLA